MRAFSRRIHIYRAEEKARLNNNAIIAATLYIYEWKTNAPSCLAQRSTDNFVGRSSGAVIGIDYLNKPDQPGPKTRRNKAGSSWPRRISSH